jgi:hypothetical protein
MTRRIRSAVGCALALGGCASTARLEIGARRIGDDKPALRVGLSVGVGWGNAPSDPTLQPTPPLTTPFTRSLTQSIGYRRWGDNSVTTTTRYLQRVGPVYASAALDIDHDGAELVPTLLVPVIHKETYTVHQAGPTPFILTSKVISLGLQVRVGRHDDQTVTGADLVVGFDGYAYPSLSLR